jgi:hypothetical protein
VGFRFPYSGGVVLREHHSGAGVTTAVRRALLSIAIAPLAIFCAGAPPSATVTNDAPESAATTPPSIVRGRFVGREVGIEIAHFGQPSLEQRLPDGLEKLSAINVADGWHWTVAREGEDPDGCAVLQKTKHQTAIGHRRLVTELTNVGFVFCSL